MNKAKSKQTARTNQKVVKNKLSDVNQKKFDNLIGYSLLVGFVLAHLLNSDCKQYQNSDKPKRKKKSLTKKERKLKI
jgi:hypothetical protein